MLARLHEQEINASRELYYINERRFVYVYTMSVCFSINKIIMLSILFLEMLNISIRKDNLNNLKTYSYVVFHLCIFDYFVIVACRGFPFFFFLDG